MKRICFLLLVMLALPTGMQADDIGTSPAGHTDDVVRKPDKTILRATAQLQIKGDVNGDGVVDADDVKEISNIIMEIPSATAIMPESADLNGDEIVNVTDIVMVIDHIKKDGGTQPMIPEGAINGKFTINASGNKVYFSKGNLQYVSSQWKFADNQWSYLTSQPDGNRDLFGWGTANNPDQTSTDNSDYPTFTDWGTNMGSGWRTLTSTEWAYLFNTRTNASSKYGHGKVNNVNGVIILPDSWTLPTDLTFTAGNSAWANNYTTEEWSQMEDAGAVFLPAAGRRKGSSLFDAGAGGYYWSSSGNTTGAYYVHFYSGNLFYQSYYSHFEGYSVRLVRIAE